MDRTRRTTALALGLAAALVLGLGAGAAAFALLDRGHTTTIVRQVAVGTSQPAAASSALSIGQIYDRSYRGVVEITVDSTANGQFGSQQQQAQGSGFVYDGNGDIVTNEHVVSGASSISVTFWNGAIYKATLVGSDPSTDLAVIKVSAPGSLLEPLALGDSSILAVGDPVVAIGSPFGLEETVTSGIVSALHRQMTAPNNFTINDSIQTDAPINHGNSGGPLLNDGGQVVGVNSQIESGSGDNAGIGFAIPSSTVRSIATQLIRSGKVEHAYLGVKLLEIPGGVAQQLGVPVGVELTNVLAGTPAAKAGLKAATAQKVVDGQSYPTGGDVITALDGAAITSSAELQTAVDAKRPGDTVTVTYARGGSTHTVTVTLGTRPS